MTLWDASSNENNESEVESVDLKADLHSDLKRLFQRLSGYELAVAVVERVRRYGVACVSQSIDGNLENVGRSGLEAIQETMRNELMHWVTDFISDRHREFVVRCHARGLSTGDAARELMNEDFPLNRLSKEDALGADLLRKILIHRLSYLKPGTARWPEKKYGNLWREEREDYVEEIVNVPLISAVEQVAALSKQSERIHNVLENETYSVKELQLLTSSLTKTLESIQKLSAVEQQESTNLSGAQLVAVLERLTVALDTPEQLALSGDTDALVSVLEQLALALKDSDKPKALGGDTEESA
jgi:hypothetical protein